MIKTKLALIPVIICAVFALTAGASAAVTIRIENGEAVEDARIAEIMMDVLSTKGYDIVTTPSSAADVVVKLQTMAELGNMSAGGPESLEAEGGDFSDGSASIESGPVLTMSQSVTASPAACRYSKILADSILRAYSRATGEPVPEAMESARLDGVVPSVLVKVDAMVNNTSFYTERDMAGQAWIAYIVVEGIDEYFRENPGATTGRGTTGKTAEAVAASGQNAAQADLGAAPEVQETSARTQEASAGMQDALPEPDASGGQDGILGETSSEAQEPSEEPSGDAGIRPPSDFEEEQAKNEAKTLLSTAVGTAYSNLPGIGKWAVYVGDLKNSVSAYAPTTANMERMQAASLIKLFIMGAVYERYEELSQTYGSDTLYGYLYPMITVSDNDAANALVGILGGGDSSVGMGAVNAYCQSHGYDCTSMGRLLLASNEFGDNYTSVVDVGKFLSEIYKTVYGGGGEDGENSGRIWSNIQSYGNMPYASEMLSLLAQQERTHKIPAGLPDGVKTANKTGELGDVENDAAIIYDTDNGNDLIIVFMSENLTEVGTAQQAISNAAGTIYDFYH